MIFMKNIIKWLISGPGHEKYLKQKLFFSWNLDPQGSKTSLLLWIWRTRTQFYRDDSLQNRGHDVRTSHTSTGDWGCVSVTVLMNDISQITVKYSSYRWVEFPYRVQQQRDDAIYGCLELLIGERPCLPVCVWPVWGVEKL